MGFLHKNNTTTVTAPFPVVCAFQDSPTPAAASVSPTFLACLFLCHSVHKRSSPFCVNVRGSKAETKPWKSGRLICFPRVCVCAVAKRGHVATSRDADISLGCFFWPSLALSGDFCFFQQLVFGFFYPFCCNAPPHKRTAHCGGKSKIIFWLVLG